jgi:subtilisin family serine protease
MVADQMNDTAAPASPLRADPVTAPGGGCSGTTAGLLGPAAVGPTAPLAAAAEEPRAYDGRGAAVIVVDDGFSADYDQSNMVLGLDLSGPGDDDAERATWRSHGSWVAEVVGDVAPGADIIHLKVLPDEGGGAAYSDIEEALAWSLANAARYGAVAVNLSLGEGNVTGAVETALSDELAALHDAGLAVTVAAGNGGRENGDGVTPFAADPHVIAVSAVDDDGGFASWTQKHPGLTDIAAPGRVRVETDEGLGMTLSGTSFAAPYVAGAVAVLQEAALDLTGERLTPEEIVAILQTTAEPVRDADPAVDGYRIADADAAVDHLGANYPDFAADVVV